MNFKRNFSAGIQNLVAVIAVTLLSACGGGAALSSNMISGVASKGPLNGASVCAYAITGGVQGKQIGSCTTTDAVGNYSIDLGTYTGPVLFQATGGSYVDEATGKTVTLTLPIHSILPNATGGSASVAVTPLTELAYMNAKANGGFTGANIVAAISSVQDNFGVADIVNTMPVDALNVPKSATAAQKTYALALATISQYQNSQPSGTSLSSAMQTIQACLYAPTTGCGTGSSSVGMLLNTAMTTFAASNTAFSSTQLPVASLGAVTTAPGNKSIAVKTLNSVSTTTCPNGGITVESGIDTNGNGVLDPTEVTNTQYVCNGTNGSNGLSTLVAVTAEPAGTNCAAGGNKISAGLDANGNSILDSSEITSASYICNGATGAAGSNGTNGMNGLNALVATVAVPAGSNCTYGGSKVTSGLDTNGNGVLDSVEVTSTSYVCNGATGPAGPGVTWVDVTATTQQAVSNTGYMADNAAHVTITLPAAPAVGDVIQVNGVGSGGWKIAANSGQSIVTTYISATPIAGTISGLQDEAIELQYVGNNTFTILNFVGTNPTALVTLPTGYVSEGGLTWMPSDTLYNYAQAASLCNGMGWRLPTQPELIALYSSGAMNSQGWTLGATWSSTPISAGYHYGVILNNGFVGAGIDTNGLYVTCVH